MFYIWTNSWYYLFVSINKGEGVAKNPLYSKIRICLDSAESPNLYQKACEGLEFNFSYIPDMTDRGNLWISET